jgi:DNA repair protein RadC
MIGHSNYAGEVRVSYHRNSNFVEIGSIKSTTHVCDKLRNILDLEYGSVEMREVAFAIFLNRANDVIGWSVLSTGTLVGVIMSPYELARQAILTNATAVIVAHNHPSGNLTPSEEDYQVTRKIKQALKLLEITLLDHLIITRNGYLSFAEEGKL